KAAEADTPVDRVLKWGYGHALGAALRLRWVSLLILGGLLASTVALLPGLGAEFMPELEEGNLWIRALLPRTVSREEAARMAQRLRKLPAPIPKAPVVMS